MNNPESVIGFAGYYGLALFAESWDIFLLALFCQVSNYLFVVLVERLVSVALLVANWPL